MATVEDAFTTWLLTKSAVTNLLGSTGGTKNIFTDKAGLSSKRPFIYVQLQSNPIEYQTSTSKGMITFATARIKLSCEADTRTVARNIAEQIRLLFLNGVQETMDTINVRAGFFKDMSDRESRTVAGDEEGLPAVICDINLNYYMPTS